jgi:hypothetical protein
MEAKLVYSVLPQAVALLAVVGWSVVERSRGSD